MLLGALALSVLAAPVEPRHLGRRRPAAGRGGDGGYELGERQLAVLRGGRTLEGGRSRGRSAFTLLPAADQCGYGADGSLPERPTPVTGG